VPSVLLDTVAVDRKNVDAVIDAGFLTSSQICTAAFAKACKAAGIA
jgi:D-xylose transport system substrate-binding protein